MQKKQNQANTLGVELHIIPIETIKASFKELNPVFGNKAQDVTEENLQARIRGIILMALSNKTGRMVVSTEIKVKTRSAIPRFMATWRRRDALKIFQRRSFIN